MDVDDRGARAVVLQSSVYTVESNRLAHDARYRDVLKAARAFRAHLQNGSAKSSSLLSTRLAIVGNSTLSFLADPLRAHLAARDINGNLTIGEYGSYVDEMLDPESPVLAARPEYLILYLDHHAINDWPSLGAPARDVLTQAERQIEFWARLWQSAHDKTGCNIVQTTLAIPPERPLGTCDSSQPYGHIYYLQTINRLLYERLPEFVSVFDADHLSGVIGKRFWFDMPHWYASRQAVQFDAMAQLAHGLASVVAAKLGRAKKCLVLDLDNTLWGGVVGDVGMENLRLQRGDSVGDAHLDFQRYCKLLKERGVLLAVCSKNETEIAKRVFEQHPDMVLKLSDISAFVANWDDKATNLRRIASQLNIGLDSMVFVDDHPAERELVRQLVPAVTVPELPVDPALYARTLDAASYFETTALSQEDLSRAQQYSAQAARDEEQSKFSDMHSFLESLEQSCTLAPVDAQSLQRVVQLLNKTNQFNLITRRHTTGSIESRMSNPTSITCCVRHADRFGDNGLISVVLASVVGEELIIEDWVMSCRVFKRGIEDCIFEHFVQLAKALRLTSIRGFYRPSDRNSIVSGLYQRFGFQELDHIKVNSRMPHISLGESEDSTKDIASDVVTWCLPSLDQARVDPHTLRCQSTLTEQFNVVPILTQFPPLKEAQHESRVA